MTKQLKDFAKGTRAGVCLMDDKQFLEWMGYVRQQAKKEVFDDLEKVNYFYKSDNQETSEYVSIPQKKFKETKKKHLEK